jgi:hypothetical protein
VLTTKIRIAVAVLAAVFGVTLATFSVASTVGPVAPAVAADDEDGGPLDEDDCEELQRLYNDAVKEGSDARADGHYEYWSHMQDVVAELYLDAQFGGCEWAAEAAPPTRNRRIPAYASQDLSAYEQSLQAISTAPSRSASAPSSIVWVPVQSG